MQREFDKLDGEYLKSIIVQLYKHKNNANL